MKKNKEKALRLSRKGIFPKLTKRQIREIAEDYRDYLTHYLRLHLSKDDFDRIVSTPYTAWDYDSNDEPVPKIGYYYHDVLEELHKAARFLFPHYRLCFFLDEYHDLAKSADKAAISDAYNIYSFAEGWGMEVLRNYFYDYADEEENESTNHDPVTLAWADTRFEEYLDAYAEAHPKQMNENPWNFPARDFHYWPWRERLSWYRQKRKAVRVEVVPHPPIDRDVELYQIRIWDQNAPSFVDIEKILFTKNIDEFQERWFRLDVYEARRKSFLASKDNNGSMLQKGTARIHDEKTFLVDDAWFSAIDWFGHHRKFHVNHWAFCVQWISFRLQDSSEVEYFRLITHEAQGVCRVEIFPRLLVAVGECYGNSLLECEAPFQPHYSANDPRCKWPRPTFEDFADNYVRSICFVVDDKFTDETALREDAKTFTITEEVMRELFEEV